MELGVNPVVPEDVAALQEGNCIVINAAPGSGKTYFIAEQIRIALEKHVRPDHIYAVTFTREAAAELVSRLDPNVRASTIHSLAYCIVEGTWQTEDTGDSRFFDDLLRQAIHAVHEGNYPDIALLAVDEAQDLTPLQAEFIAALAAKAGLTYIVGDPAQSIFGFAGGDPACMRRFQGTFPPVRLPVTRRFGTDIARAVNRAFDFDPIEAIQPGGVVVVESMDSRDRPGLHRRIEALCAESTEPTIGVLFRTNAEIGAFVKSVERAEAYNYTVPLSSHEFVSFASVVLLMDRNIPAEDLLRMAEFLGYGTRPLRRVIAALATGQRSGKLALTYDVLRALARQGRSVDAMVSDAGRRDLLNVLDTLGLFRNHAGPPSLERVAPLLVELRTLGYQTAGVLDPDETSLAHAIMRRLTTGNETYYQVDNGSRVTVQTIHSAKGREFDHVVFVVNPRQDIYSAEEQRVAYVAMTRARHRLDVLVPIVGFEYREDQPSVLASVIRAGHVL